MSIFEPLSRPDCGSVFGGSSVAAQVDLRGSVSEANLMKIMPWLDMRDELRVYKDADESYQAAKDAGYYGGQTRAGMDDRTRTGLDAGYGWVNEQPVTPRLSWTQLATSLVITLTSTMSITRHARQSDRLRTSKR